MAYPTEDEIKVFKKAEQRPGLAAARAYPAAVGIRAHAQGGCGCHCGGRVPGVIGGDIAVWRVLL